MPAGFYLLIAAQFTSALADNARLIVTIAWLHETGRVEYTYATDAEALDGFQELSQTEGIIPALESSHAIAYVKKLAPTLSKDKLIIVNLSGRGDKDVAQAARMIFGEELKF